MQRSAAEVWDNVKPARSSTHLSQQLLHAASAIEVHEALMAFKNEARAEGRQTQLRNGPVVQYLQHTDRW